MAAFPPPRNPATELLSDESRRQDESLLARADRQYERGVGAGLNAGIQHGIDAERLRLRPLLERCEALARAQQHLNQRLRHPDEEAGALLGDILADLHRELGKDGGG